MNEKSELMTNFSKTLKLAEKLKKVMLKKGLTRAKAKCPRCDGHLQGRIQGTRNHLWMKCDGTCGTVYME